MKQILTALTLTLLFACGSEKKNENAEAPAKDTITTDYLLRNNSINDLVIQNHQALKDVKGDLYSFKAYLAKLDNNNVASIPFALDYIKTCIPANSPDGDSIFLLFDDKFNAITGILNDSLETRYMSMSEQMEKDSNSAELSSFKNNLAVCGIGLFPTEGMYYMDVIPDFFNTNFKDRVSEAGKEFLIIRRDEAKQGYSDDGGLVISFEELYQRVKRWENFRNKYPDAAFRKYATSYYREYLMTFMTGMDNTPVFENGVLLPEMKALYEKITKEDQETASAKIISSYYAMLARHDFKQDDSIMDFLKENNLGIMPAVGEGE